MTKTFDTLCNKILGETVMTATPSPNQQKPGQPNTTAPTTPGQPAKPGQPVKPPTPVDQARLKKITDSLTQIQDPAHLEAVEKLLMGLNNPQQNAATPQA